MRLYTPFSRHLRQTRAKRKDNRSLKNEIRSNASRMGLDPEGMRQLKCLCRANTVKGLFGGPHGQRLTLLFLSESLILAQNERWQRGLGMQVERDPMDE